MIRKIVHIDGDRCTGCGACADACHEGAIAMVKGRAKLLRDDYCDGLGDCLPACPADAITIGEREAADYDERLVALHKRHLEEKAAREARGAGADDGLATAHRAEVDAGRVPGTVAADVRDAGHRTSQLSQWPCQLELVSPDSAFFDGADVLVAADCTAFAYPAIHDDFMHGRVTLIGCPKLDASDYSEKLSAIISGNSIRSLAVLRMEVPCCGGMVFAVRKGLEASGKDLPLEVHTVSTDGRLLG